ncbi:flagellar hook-basal body complex protein FliE [Nocardioides sp. Arc9.136]|uniref:flagellar hook-basal body complex protein FliE n=1 Tax=Nocardioides sp. Arc9.136 TaxID=2996826 RepID=UPI0026664F8A|nr:flagellar hook-basal body complex protein FliE [Nocardioides sp. Arc9.136]WKN47617.1 flagellar hook-basal body complex protein FliE [Nocardioides sp. Arc9.136]
MSVAGIEGFVPLDLAQVRSTDPTTSVAGARGPQGPEAADGPSFSSFLVDGLDRLDGVQRTADDLAVRAATGDLQNIHDYTIAASEAAVTTQVTVAVRNKAVEAFTEIMRMQV